MDLGKAPGHLHLLTQLLDGSLSRGQRAGFYPARLRARMRMQVDLFVVARVPDHGRAENRWVPGRSRSVASVLV